MRGASNLILSADVAAQKNYSRRTSPSELSVADSGDEILPTARPDRIILCADRIEPTVQNRQPPRNLVTDSRQPSPKVNAAKRLIPAGCNIRAVTWPVFP